MGYDYLCTRTTPLLNASITSLAVPQTFITQQTQASFTIWNGGGGKLTGTVSVPAPFSIVSGGSFSLSPGQPQEVVVKFSSATPGSFSKSISISSNGGNKTVTATSVAHKVSFSPATLDFGSGLLVLREQCNQMGTCGLGTEKVGLPIEKALTVKNEGTVAVTLTLSAAAPYSIVSVLPTLAPGQSGQVTLRFDPTESGSFTGNVQVGINGGQGSVSSSPLVGVAHKIEIDPTVLNFGIVFVGSTKEQTLTVKNQGVTTVTLEIPNVIQNTSSSFRIMLEQPLTLSPGESKEILVRCSPTTSGVFQESVRLMSGSVILGIPAIAKTMTYEEYLQALLEAHNTIVQDLGAYGIVYGWNRYRQFDFIAAGFPGMGATDFEGLWDFAEQMLHSSPDVQVDPTTADKLRRVLEMLQTINSDDLINWMELLSTALEQGRFDEEYERLLPQGLDRFQAIFVEVLGLTPQDAQSVIRELVGSLTDLTFVLDQGIPEPYATQIKQAMRFVEVRLKVIFSLPEGILSTILGVLPQIAELLGLPGLTPFELIDLTIQRWDTAIRVMIALGFSPGEMVMFSWDIRDLYIYLFQGLAEALNDGNTARIIGEAIKILLRTGEFAKLFDWMTDPFNQPRSQRDRSEQGFGTIHIAANAVRTGWQYNGLVLDLRGSYTQNYGDWWGASVLLSREESVSRRSIVTLARGDHCTQCGDKAKEIGDWVARALQLLPGQVAQYGADLGVVTVVFTNPDSSGIVNNVLPELQRRFGGSDKIIIVSWMDSYGQVWWVCIGACQKLKPEEAEQIACNMHGLPANCGAKNWEIIDGSKFDQIERPPMIVLEPVDWFEADPWYFTREWLCSMTREQAAGQGLEGLWDSLCS